MPRGKQIYKDHPRFELLGKLQDMGMNLRRLRTHRLNSEIRTPIRFDTDEGSEEGENTSICVAVVVYSSHGGIRCRGSVLLRRPTSSRRRYLIFLRRSDSVRSLRAQKVPLYTQCCTPPTDSDRPRSVASVYGYVRPPTVSPRLRIC